MNESSRSTLSTRAAESLGRYGWFPGRRIDVTRYARAYERQGLPVFAPALEFFAEFGDLCVRYHEPEVLEVVPGSDTATVLTFDADHWVLRSTPDAVAHYFESEWHRRLVPIGTAFSDNMTLLMDAEGWVIAAHHPEFWVMGETGIHALNTFYADTYPTLEDWRARGFGEQKE
jgi:hypothetical protein